MSTYNGNIGHWIAWWGSVTKERVAIVFKERRITYREFNTKINRIANALKDDIGIKKGDRVACLLNNCVEFLEVVFACSKIGARFVPLNVRLVGSELAYIVNDSSPRIIFTENRFCKILEEIKSIVSVEKIVNIDLEEYESLARSAGEHEPADQATWEDDFSILYTSGTTGLPKGAVLTQENVKAVTYQQMTSIGYTNRECIIIPLPLCFMGALVPMSMPIMHSGGTIILDTDFDPERFLRTIEIEKVTLMCGIPTMFKMMSDLPIFDSIDFSHVTIAGSGGAPVPLSLIRIYQKKGVPFYNGYGLTEGSGTNMYLPIEYQEKIGAYTPMLWNEIKVVDERGCPIMPGEIGEITIKGPVVMRCYWNLPDATAQTIRDGWLYTGDLASVDEEGYIYIVDRKKDMIISGGLNVYSAEVENVLFAHPSLSEVAVVGLPHEIWGEAVTAFVAAKRGMMVEANEIKTFWAERLADYKTPKVVVIVDALPRNAGGKVLKRMLRDKYKDLFGVKGARVS